MSESGQLQQVHWRIRKDLLARLRDQAEADHRDVTNQVEAYIEAGLKADGRKLA